MDSGMFSRCRFVFRRPFWGTQDIMNARLQQMKVYSK